MSTTETNDKICSRSSHVGTPSRRSPRIIDRNSIHKQPHQISSQVEQKPPSKRSSSSSLSNYQSPSSSNSSTLNDDDRTDAAILRLTNQPTLTVIKERCRADAENDYQDLLNSLDFDVIRNESILKQLEESLEKRGISLDDDLR